MLEMHAKVYGNVHGVGFRATTIAFARELDLTGAVRNCSDGTVEIIAQGNKIELEKLLAKLKEAFVKRYIDKIDVQFVKPTQTYSGFSLS